MRKELFDFSGNQYEVDDALEKFEDYASDLSNWTLNSGETPNDITTLNDLREAALSFRTPDNRLHNFDLTLPFITDTGEHQLNFRFSVADNMEDMQAIDDYCAESVGYCSMLVVEADMKRGVIAMYGAVGSDSLTGIYPVMHDRIYHDMTRLSTDDDLHRLLVSAVYHFTDDDSIMNSKLS
jgi:hypothetical protein